MSRIPSVDFQDFLSTDDTIPFFMHPVSDMKLDVLENCIDKDNPKQFEYITAGEFLTERLTELVLIKK